MQTQTVQHESATAASQTAAMLSLNLKLQSSAAKNQAKHIELEIKKLEARETRDLLGIVQVRIPLSPPYSIIFYSTTWACVLMDWGWCSRTCRSCTSTRIATRRAATCSSSASRTRRTSSARSWAQAHGLPDALNGPVSPAFTQPAHVREDPLPQIGPTALRRQAHRAFRAPLIITPFPV